MLYILLQSRMKTCFSLRHRLTIPFPCGKKKLSSVLCLLLLGLAAHLCIISLVPLSWREADFPHVVRVITDLQNFPTDKLNDASRQQILQKIFAAKTGLREIEMRGSGAAINVTKNFLTSPGKLNRNSDYFPELFHKLEALEAAPLPPKEPSVSKTRRMLSVFRPILTQNEKSQLLRAFDAFVYLCDAAGVTYFLLEASLMGVRRHHGMIPWDDDIDIVVDASQWDILHAVLSSADGFQLFAPSDVQWKFFVNTSKPFPDKPFKFPYLDIFFFRGDEDFVWAITEGLKHDLVHRRADIFPLVRRPFEGRLVPVPNNLPLLVDQSHDVSECVTGEYNHKTNERFYYSGKVSIPCEHLRDVYPFVDRELKEGGLVVEETLRVGRRVVHRFVFRDAVTARRNLDHE